VPRAGARPIGPFVLSAPGLRLLQDAIFPAQARKGSGKALGILAGIGAAAAGAAILGGGNGTANDDIQPPGNQTGP